MTGGDGSEPMTAEDDNPRQITGGPWRSPFCFGRETGWKKEKERREIGREMIKK